MLLMRPDAETNNAYVYCLAYAAERYGVEVMFTVAMSNHHHTGIYDRYGKYPEFLECFHKLFAKCQNALRGRWENFWSSEQTSVVRLLSGQDVVNKLVYAVCNPVQAALVEHALQWPGVSSLRATLEGRGLCAQRPGHFFREGSMPEKLTLRFFRPPQYAQCSEQEWKDLVLERVREQEKLLARARAQQGQRVLGVRSVLNQRWSARPQKPEPRRGLKPRLAAHNKWKRVEALLQNESFLVAYRSARAAFQAGLRTVLFPVGTYWLRRFADVVCEDTPYLAA
jgi:putative transposase